MELLQLIEELSPCGWCAFCLSSLCLTPCFPTFPQRTVLSPLKYNPSHTQVDKECTSSQSICNLVKLHFSVFAISAVKRV